MRLTLLLPLFSLGLASHAEAQTEWTYRARTAAETTATHANARSPLAQAAWRHEPRLVASLDGTWTSGDALRAGAAVTALAADGSLRLRTRELYVRAAATSWLEVEAGRRILRWGVGYGFAPAGVLDPPRLATDPSDRLQLNEGRTLVRADAFRGDTSLTVAAADGLAASRLATVFAGGVEVGVIAAAATGEGPRYAATVTHVVGQQLEWHAEAVVHDHGDRRELSAAAGIQYTVAAGLNVVLEYHRDGRGLDDKAWQEVLGGRRAPGTRPSRRNMVFARIARSGTDLRIVPEVIVIAGLDDGSWTLVPSIIWAPHARAEAYVRATRLIGPPRSLARLAPFSTSVTAGAAARF